MSFDYILSIIVYLIFLIYSGIIIYITYKALRRNVRSKLNQVFASFCLTMSSSSVLTFYILFRNPALSLLATVISVSAFFIGAIGGAGLLFLYSLILFKYDIMSKLKNILIYLIIYFGITSIMLFIPEGMTIEVVTNSIVVTTMNLEFFLFFFITLLIMLIATLYLSSKNLSSFTNKELKKRFLFYIGGVGLFFSYPMFTSILIFFHLSFFFYTIIIFIIVFLGLSFIYYGLAKTLED
ncbi:MAG: hypothetical protein EAX91_08500 [Candidatus Lokiarchaeota archaeon]|nr:hypothetical protein [Candidatus Lokiarchaeota archaeon]